MALRVVFILVAVSIVQCELLESCSQTAAFVDGHNRRRLQLARGQVARQPAASRMTNLVWDEELATKAKNWAARNKYGHNPDHSIPSGRFPVGENIYYYGTTEHSFEFSPEKALAGWWGEHARYQYGPLTARHFAGARHIGHYTQMAWAKTTRIGCGVSKYSEGDWMKFFVVCNYGPAGNFIGEPPYDSAAGAGGQLVCDDDCDRPYGEQC